jgi:hypothetical protein
MENPAPQPTFPAGLRVLVVDDDPLCLRIVEKMLKRCQYVGEYEYIPLRGNKKKSTFCGAGAKSEKQRDDFLSDICVPAAYRAGRGRRAARVSMRHNPGTVRLRDTPLRIGRIGCRKRRIHTYRETAVCLFFPRESTSHLL